MPRKAEIPIILTKGEKAKLKELEGEYTAIIERLRNDPSNSSLSLELRLIEVDMVRITRETTIDY